MNPKINHPANAGVNCKHEHFIKCRSNGSAKYLSCTDSCYTVGESKIQRSSTALNMNKNFLQAVTVTVFFSKCNTVRKKTRFGCCTSSWVSVIAIHS